MATHIMRFKDTIAAGSLQLKLECRDSSLFLDEDFILLELGDISIGDDKQSDYIYYPSSFTAKVYINKTLADWKIRIDELSTSDFVYSHIIVNGNIIHIGSVDKESVSGDPIKQTIRFTCYDQSKQLKDILPSSNPFSYTLTDILYIEDILKDIVAHPSRYLFPFIQSVDYKGTLQVRNYIASSEQIFTFGSLGVMANFYFDTDSQYEHLGHLLKSILINFNCIGYYSLTRKLLLVPRLYEGQTVQTIQREDLLSNPDYKMTYREIEGIKAKLWTGSVPKSNTSHYSVITYGNVNSENENDKTRVDVLDIDIPFGNFPPAPDSTISSTTLFGRYGGTWYLLDFDTIGYDTSRVRDTNGNYYPWAPLYKFATEKVWAFFNTYPKRVTLHLELKGLWDKWDFDKYYQLLDIEGVYRIVKAKYNFYKNRTTVVLKQVK